MELLLTILSVLAAWTFLAVLVVGLFLIYKPLQSVRGYLEKIAMGVRAIEKQTSPLRGGPEELNTALRDTGKALAAAAGRFEDASRL